MVSVIGVISSRTITHASSRTSVPLKLASDSRRARERRWSVARSGTASSASVTAALAIGAPRAKSARVHIMNMSAPPAAPVPCSRKTSAVSGVARAPTCGKRVERCAPSNTGLRHCDDGELLSEVRPASHGFQDLRERALHVALRGHERAPSHRRPERERA